MRPVKKLFPVFTILMICFGAGSCAHEKKNENRTSDSNFSYGVTDKNAIYAVLVSPQNPAPGQPFKLLATGDSNIDDLKIEITGHSVSVTGKTLKSGTGLPYWKIIEFEGLPKGEYKIKTSAKSTLLVENELHIGGVYAALKTDQGWTPKTEALYSAWINALFYGCDERSTWNSLHAVTQNSENNFLYNYLSINEDNPDNNPTIKMQPDCADNPFFLRAYFSWKTGLPMAYHICDRGGIGRNPGTGKWMITEPNNKGKGAIREFNQFLLNLMNGVHSGTARTALNNNNSDYYPVALSTQSLRPGVVFADPYGHTLTLVSWQHQSKDKPGILLAVDAQPDGTVGIKRFWKGNFMFNTSNVIGEPGFKAFRPILASSGNFTLLKNSDLTEESGFVPFSAQQQKMSREDFYLAMERAINPNPLDPETALLNLINALHEQLIVRVTSVNNGDIYFKKNPGAIIPMSTNAPGVFLTGGQWENYSTPNRDLRLLIALDAVSDFPNQVVKRAGDFKISRFSTPEKEKEKLEKLLIKKCDELTIKYLRSDGSEQTLSLTEIIKRKDAFEMGYNPNDGPEIRWGAPEGSGELSTCRRKAPASQRETMQKVRTWFQQRLHPPT